MQFLADLFSVNTRMSTMTAISTTAPSTAPRMIHFVLHLLLSTENTTVSRLSFDFDDTFTLVTLQDEVFSFTFTETDESLCKQSSPF